MILNDFLKNFYSKKNIASLHSIKHYCYQNSKGHTLKDQIEQIKMVINTITQEGIKILQILKYYEMQNEGIV